MKNLQPPSPESPALSVDTRRRALITGGVASLLAGAGLGAGVAEAAETSVKFSELYARVTPLGMELSSKVRQLSGQRVQVLGYVAPPLKADAGFFVLTRVPVAVCPFCNSDSDWPSDIVVVYLKGALAQYEDGTPVAVTGTLEIGSKTDPRTGFVSLVRLVGSDITPL